MMWHTYFRRIIHSVAILVTSFGFASTHATAGWIFIDDVDAFDGATNPGYPRNQRPAIVGAYLQDLLNLAEAPTRRGHSDAYDGGAFSGLGNPTAPEAFLLAFHFGNGNDDWEHDGPFDVFFSCLTDCDVFAPEDTKGSSNYQGSSNYRLYSASVDLVDEPCCATVERVNGVPEPGSVALLGLGLAGLGFSRRKLN